MIKKSIYLIIFVLLVIASIWVIRRMDSERDARNAKATLDAENGMKGDEAGMDTVMFEKDTLVHNGEAVTYATTHIKAERLKNLKDDLNNFSGKSYYNKAEGYYFKVEHPEKWNPGYFEGYKVSNDYPANTLRAGDSIVFEVTKLIFETDLGIEDYMNGTYLPALYPRDAKRPEIKYNYNDQCAFFRGFHRIYGEELYSKVYVLGKKGFLASVRFPKKFESDPRVKEFLNMVSSFTMVD
jgi:hypothetical protein